VIGTGDDTARDTAGPDGSTTSPFSIDCTASTSVISLISEDTLAPHAFACTTAAALSAVLTSMTHCILLLSAGRILYAGLFAPSQ
jgi:hypothetical protein